MSNASLQDSPGHLICFILSQYNGLLKIMMYLLLEMPPPASFNWIPFCALCTSALESALADSCLDTPLFVLWETGHNMLLIRIKGSREGQILKEPLTAAWHEAGVIQSNCVGVGRLSQQIPGSYLLGWWREGFISNPHPFRLCFCSAPHPWTRSYFQVSSCCRNIKGNAHFFWQLLKNPFVMSLARLFPSWELLLPVPWAELAGELGPLLFLVKKGNKPLFWAAVMTQRSLSLQSRFLQTFLLQSHLRKLSRNCRTEFCSLNIWDA